MMRAVGEDRVDRTPARARDDLDDEGNGQDDPQDQGSCMCGPEVELRQSIVGVPRLRILCALKG